MATLLCQLWLCDSYPVCVCVCVCVCACACACACMCVWVYVLYFMSMYVWYMSAKLVMITNNYKLELLLQM